MTGIVRIALLIVRVAGRDPMTVSVGRVTVIAANPDILTIPPFVMTGNPNGGMVGLLPLLIVLLRRWRPLSANVYAE